ncbi:hypothetical protein [Streptomyces sp. NPDC093149]|uniref:hypothetical protein n=1 Tax=Streptomyces sp. NPDC093149 TaxID=3366031 RepID=UPI00380CF126
MYCGVVPDGVDDLGLDGLEWTGDATMLITYVKERTARESSNLPAPAVRLLERWLEYSAPLRNFADAEIRGQLWISYTPKVIHHGRIRATYHERLARRGWTGRATIDPNHTDSTDSTDSTEDDHVAPPPSARAVDTDGWRGCAHGLSLPAVSAGRTRSPP